MRVECVLLVAVVAAVVVSGTHAQQSLYDTVEWDANTSTPFRIPQAGSNYAPLTDYYIHIHAPNETPHVAINITKIVTECGWDFMYVYDGPTPDDPIVLVASYDTDPGPKAPAVFLDSQNPLLRLHSDPYILGSGVEGFISFSPCPRDCSGHGTCTRDSSSNTTVSSSTSSGLAGDDGNSTESWSCRCELPYYGPSCNETLVLRPDPESLCDPDVVCKCPDGFSLNHDEFLRRVGAAQLKSMRRLRDGACVLDPSHGITVDSAPRCAACPYEPDPPYAGPWTLFEADPCACDFTCVNGTCNLATQQCECFDGYIGLRCDVKLTPSTTGYVPPTPSRFEGSSTLSNVFVLVVLTLLVFIVVIAVMLCKHRGIPPPIIVHRTVQRPYPNVPIFVIHLEPVQTPPTTQRKPTASNPGSVNEEDTGGPSNAAADAAASDPSSSSPPPPPPADPFPIVLEDADGNVVSHFVLRGPHRPDSSPIPALAIGSVILLSALHSDTLANPPTLSSLPPAPYSPSTAPLAPTPAPALAPTTPTPPSLSAPLTAEHNDADDDDDLTDASDSLSDDNHLHNPRPRQ